MSSVFIRPPPSAYSIPGGLGEPEVTALGDPRARKDEASDAHRVA